MPCCLLPALCRLAHLPRGKRYSEANVAALRSERSTYQDASLIVGAANTFSLEVRRRFLDMQNFFKLRSLQVKDI